MIPTFYNSDNDSHSTVLSPLSVPSDDNPLYDAQDSLTYTNINEMRIGSDTESESDTSAPEVWSESDRDDVDDFATPSETEKSVSHVQNIICLYLTFLQLCYPISDRAVAFLLSLFVAVFSYLSSISSNNETLRQFADTFPRTIYSLRKRILRNRSYQEFVVCPRCEQLYLKEKCTMKIGSGVVSLTCSYIEFPSHPLITIGLNVEQSL